MANFIKQGFQKTVRATYTSWADKEQGYKDFLGECVDNGSLDLPEAQKLIENEDQHIVEDMMEKGGD